jgi:TatD DNase family protein
MLIDIHRHANDTGTADNVLRNLFHSQGEEIEPGKVYSIGLHPWHVEDPKLNEDLGLVKKFSSHPQIIAIGEAGLDKSIRAPFELQMLAFKSQVEIAKIVKKPMIIHCVRAYNEISELKIKSGHTQPWIIHWFNSGVDMGLQLIKKGFYLSFGHMLFNEDSKAFKSFLKIPVESIFFETDDAGYRIDEVYQRASELLSVSRHTLEKRIENNYENFFGFKP